LGLEFGWVENCDEVTLFDLSSFIDEELRDASADLRADDDLIRIHSTDQNKIFPAWRRKEVIARRDQQNDAENDCKLIASTHARSPCDADGRTNKAAEMKSRTNARRSAMLSGASGSIFITLLRTGAALKYRTISAHR